MPTACTASSSSGAALVAVIASGLAGAATFAFVALRRSEPARYGAAVAVGAVVAAWGFARYPILLPGLPVRQAASSHDTLVALIVAILAGGAILFPSLMLLFRLSLGGRLSESGRGPAGLTRRGWTDSSGSRPALGRLAAGLLIIGVGLLNVADADWAHAVGVISLFAFMLASLVAILPPAASDGGERPDEGDGAAHTRA